MLGPPCAVSWVRTRTRPRPRPWVKGSGSCYSSNCGFTFLRITGAEELSQRFLRALTGLHQRADQSAPHPVILLRLQRIANSGQRRRVFQLPECPRGFEPGVGVLVAEEFQQAGRSAPPLVIHVSDGPGCGSPYVWIAISGCRRKDVHRRAIADV